MTKRIIVTGSRSFSDKTLLDRALDSAQYYFEDMVVVHGGASGADALAEQWCQAHGVPSEPHPADWDTYGKSAGPIRKRQMAALGAVFGVAFLDDSECRGTKNCIREMEAVGIPVHTFHQP